MLLYNTLTRKKEEFVPLNPPTVGLYTCGPTVYDYMQIGNWRTFTFEDILRRLLIMNGYRVTQVMNITDVGHLSGDNAGDADVGTDRMDKAAKREGKNVWDVAQFYLDDFIKTRDWLNIQPPEHLVRATDHIQEQQNLIKTLLEKGIAYETETGIFFDVTKFPKYGKLGGQKLIDKRVAVREEVEEDKSKRNPQDFALWFKTIGKFADHQMHWSSPWGEGFPGWHIECSAMSMKYLGESFDIHTGGVDHIAIHHTNEIAQSEGATGKSLAKYWMHGEFLTVDGGRMGKSLGNAYTLYDVKEKGIDTLALRYLYLGAHYRDRMNFTWDSLVGAQTALFRLQNQFSALSTQESRQSLSPEKEEEIEDYRNRFVEALNDDLNTPQALAIVWEVAKSNIPSTDKRDLLLSFDEVLGIGIDQPVEVELNVSVEVQKLLDTRDEARKNKDFAKADALRNKIKKLGYEIKDSENTQKLTKL